MLLVLDPKIYSCGVALFDHRGGQLQRTSWVAGPGQGNTPESWKATALEVVDWLGDDQLLIKEFVFERPPAYWSDNPKKTLYLQGLLGVCCILAGMVSRAKCTAYYPSAQRVTGAVEQGWKGKLSKEQTEHRVRSRLTPQELAVVQLTKNKDHNSDIWDAVGIGMFHLGRLHPHKVYSR